MHVPSCLLSAAQGGGHPPAGRSRCSDEKHGEDCDDELRGQTQPYGGRLRQRSQTVPAERMFKALLGQEQSWLSHQQQAESR